MWTSNSREWICGANTNNMSDTRSFKESKNIFFTSKAQLILMDMFFKTVYCSKPKWKKNELRIKWLIQRMYFFHSYITSYKNTLPKYDSQKKQCRRSCCWMRGEKRKKNVHSLAIRYRRNHRGKRSYPRSVQT